MPCYLHSTPSKLYFEMKFRIAKLQVINANMQYDNAMSYNANIHPRIGAQDIKSQQGS